ncbi:PAS domain-containing protein [Spirosoma sp. BT702]|uniref:histidine kinase n=1 Tax=Spirosoma profusum TaxID=2771354 RepID=A0A926XW16_9BACT|nr:ATP-binding protein [Spirosoma profusum]MBD2700831.1 PAS domain-containing protein [Spirosoma profusum]
MNPPRTNEQLAAENESLRIRLDEALETIQAIRTGQIDALVVEGDNGHEIYTLKTADQTYRVFIESMHEGAVTLNQQGLILYCNSTFATMVNQPLSAVIGSDLLAYIAPACQADYKNFIQQSWSSPGKTEMTLAQKENEKEIICLISATPLALDEGDCLSFIFTDLTLQKQTQTLLKRSNEELAFTNQALNRSNDNLQQFAYVASHDLQEPLRKIQQFGDLLKTRYVAPSSDEWNYLERMQSAASRMSALIRDILNFSRITTHTESVRHVSLTDVVNTVLTDLELRIQETNALIEVSPLPILMGDASQLGRLFQNLLNNALKFHRPDVKPHIKVACQTLSAAELPPSIKPTRQADTYHQIQVIDNGIGFDQKYAERIFQVFQRLHNKNQFAGTGIGLAICEKIVSNHGGAISATGEPSKGATFSVYLPV